LSVLNLALRPRSCGDENRKHRKNATPKKKAAELDLKNVGRRIREIRGFDMTQAEFGKVLGVAQTTLSKYEKGQAAPFGISRPVKWVFREEHRLDSYRRGERRRRQLARRL
jgi:DNA-binding XRE family transcriptional regulator